MKLFNLNFKTARFAIVLAVIMSFAAVQLPFTVRAEDTGDKLIALTFDDGPGQFTSELIDGLDEIGAKATFFMLGSNIDYYPEALEKMYKSGHELANHSWSHPLFTKKDYATIESEVMDTNKLLEKVDGNPYHLLRCPYGASNDDVSSIVNQLIVHWSIDTGDWETLDAQAVKEEVLASAYDGAIVLAHDIYKTSVDGMLAAARELTNQGYTLVTVSELVARRGLELNSGETVFDARNKGITLPPTENGGKEEAIGKAYVSSAGFLRSTDNTDSAIKGIVPTGTVVDILKEGDSYLKIRSAWGASGFISSSSLKIVEGDSYPKNEISEAERTPAAGDGSYSSPSCIREVTDLYSSKDGGSSLAKLPAGSDVTILEDSSDKVVLACTAGGVTGYVNKELLEPHRSETGRHREKNKTGVEYDPGDSGAAISSINLRDEPSNNSSILSVIEEGTELKVLETVKNNWCKVSTQDGKEGYVRTYSLGEQPLKAAKVTADVNFRAKPSTDGQVIDLISTGTGVKCLGKADKGWQMVLTSDSRLGYISTDFIEEL